MARKPLTAAAVRTAKPGDTLWDETVPGLHLRCFPGKRVYALYYRSPTERKPSGKPVERRLKLGDEKVLTLPEARNLGQRTLLVIANGTDPVTTKRQHAEEPTVDALFKKAHAGHWSNEKYVVSGWKAEVKRIYERSIKPTFGAKLARNGVTLAAIIEWHSGGAKNPRTANIALAVLSKMLTLGEQYEWRTLNSNPCIRVTRHAEGKRDRFAQIAEIAQVGALLNKYAAAYPAAVAFLYILIFSGARPRSIARASWDQLTEFQINGQTWGRLKFQGKTGADKVYLPPPAMAVITALPRTDGTITGMGLPRKLWAKIRQEAGCEDLWMRDWRRTFATVGMSAGEAMARISELLNHKSTQTTKIYAKLMDGEKMEVAGQIAGHLENFLSARMPGKIRKVS